MTLSDLLEPTRVSANEFSVAIPDGWQQGRGAFGGLVLGAMVRCLELNEPDATRAVRSLAAEIAGPVLVGSWRVVVEPLRRGNAVSTVRASLLSGDEVLAHVVAVLGRARPETPQWEDVPSPNMLPWSDIAPVQMDGPPWPAFANHFEYRNTGPFPFSGGTEAIAAGWIRAREPGQRRGAAMLTALMDAWWPAAMARLSEPRVFATISFGLQVVGDLSRLAPEAPLFYTARAPVSRDGYFVEIRELWTGDGHLLAVNHQTFAIIK